MSLDRSLKGKSTLERHRNVLRRMERIVLLEDNEKWTESKSSVFGLVKVGHRKQAAAKKAAKTEEGVTATPVGGKAAAPAAGAKAAAPARRLPPRNKQFPAIIKNVGPHTRSDFFCALSFTERNHRAATRSPNPSANFRRNPNVTSAVAINTTAPICENVSPHPTTGLSARRNSNPNRITA